MSVTACAIGKTVSLLLVALTAYALVEVGAERVLDRKAGRSLGKARLVFCAGAECNDALITLRLREGEGCIDSSTQSSAIKCNRIDANKTPVQRLMRSKSRGRFKKREGVDAILLV